MLLVNMAFVSIVSAKEVVNAAENTKDGNEFGSLYCPYPYMEI